MWWVVNKEGKRVTGPFDTKDQALDVAMYLVKLGKHAYVELCDEREWPRADEFWTEERVETLNRDTPPFPRGEIIR